jgi:hypothetical protein
MNKKFFGSMEKEVSVVDQFEKYLPKIVIYDNVIPCGKYSQVGLWWGQLYRYLLVSDLEY